MYACETWTVYSRHAKKLNRLHLNYLRRLLHIFWQDKVPDTEVLNCTELPSVHTLEHSPALLVWSCYQSVFPNVCSTAGGLWGSSLLVPSKPPWKTLTSIQSHGRVLQLRDVLGAASSGRAPSPLKRTGSAKHFNTRFSPCLLNVQQNFPCLDWPHQSLRGHIARSH